MASIKSNFVIFKSNSDNRNNGMGGSSGVHRNFSLGEGVSTNSVEDKGQRERGSRGGSPLVRGSGGSCDLEQEISFH